MNAGTGDVEVKSQESTIKDLHKIFMKSMWESVHNSENLNTHAAIVQSMDGYDIDTIKHILAYFIDKTIDAHNIANSECEDETYQYIEEHLLRTE